MGGVVQQQYRRNLGPWGSAEYTIAALGLGCPVAKSRTRLSNWTELKDSTALISEAIPGITTRGWGSEKEKGERNQWGVHYLLTAYGQLDLSHNVEYWEREECDSDVLPKERGSWGSYVPTAAETHWGIQEKGALWLQAECSGVRDSPRQVQVLECQ